MTAGATKQDMKEEAKEGKKGIIQPCVFISRCL